MAYKNPSDQRACWRRWYKRNRRKHIAHSAAWKKAFRLKVRLILQRLRHMKRCVDCRNKYPHWIMQFDHVRGQKLGNVTQMANMGFTLKEIRKEISKCEIVCANCHSDRTHQRGL